MIEFLISIIPTQTIEFLQLAKTDFQQTWSLKKAQQAYNIVSCTKYLIYISSCNMQMFAMFAHVKLPHILWKKHKTVLICTKLEGIPFTAPTSDCHFSRFHDPHCRPATFQIGFPHFFAIPQQFTNPENPQTVP